MAQPTVLQVARRQADTRRPRRALRRAPLRGRPPTAAELDAVLTALGKQPWEVARLSEPVAAELGMKSWPHERDRWIAAMVEHPILIERPILVTDDGRAVLGRPPDVIERFLGTGPGPAAGL